MRKGKAGTIFTNTRIIIATLNLIFFEPKEVSIWIIEVLWRIINKEKKKLQRIS
jgi:hypothetical protein